MAKRDAQFHDYVVLDLLADIPGITSRGMFGGYGIYKDGHFFALIANGELYFKVDEMTRGEYERSGSHAFRYDVKGREQVTLGYWTLPDDVMENRGMLADWVDKAVSVAVRAKNDTKARKK